MNKREAIVASGAPTTTATGGIGDLPELADRSRMRSRWIPAAAVVVALIAVAGVVLVGDPFGGGGQANGAVAGSATQTSLATSTRQTLSSQTQVSATLGYAGSSSIVVPAGSTPSALAQAQQSVTSAEGQLQAAKVTLAADARALEAARARLAADRQKRAVDCRGGNAAQSAASSSPDGTGSSSGTCATDQQTVLTDEQNLTAAAAKVASDEQAVASSTHAVAGAVKSASAAESSATAYGDSSSYTLLPAVGTVVRRGQTLYRISDQPVVLLYGSIAAWRAFATGMSPGRDVAELNANLRELGYGKQLAGNRFSSATAAAIRAFQSAHRLSPTGRLLLGAVVFKSGPVRITSVTPKIGAAVQPGPVLEVTSTVRQVEVELDATQQADVKVGDPVTITLPDNQTTPGVVSSVGTVATAPADEGAGGGVQDPTIEVHVTPSNPAATGRLDQAPVQVSITTASVKDALVVPVDSLLALAGGGYAVEEVTAGGVHRLVPVTLGLFDDANGLVEVTGTTLTAGRHVVVPST